MNKSILTIVSVALAVSLNAQSQPQRNFFRPDPANPDAHDPVMARCDGRYYLFTTGIGCLTSTDMLEWQQGPRVMNQAPQWALESVPGYRGHTWAPDVSYHNGLWYMYYSCSSFGKNGSAIGLMTNRTLNPESPDYRWEDQGMVVQSITNQTDRNAIDPNLIVDAKGRPWLTWGSFWGGIQLVRLDKDFKTPKGKIINVARRYPRLNMDRFVSDADKELANQAPDAGANAIEARYLQQHGHHQVLPYSAGLSDRRLCHA